MTVAPAVFVSSNASFCSVGENPGICSMRQAGHRGARPDGHHAVAVLAENEGLHLRRRHLQPAGQVAAKTGRVQLRAEADDALPGQTGTLHGQVGQDVDRIADHDQVAVFFEAGRLGLFEQTQEEIDVAIDEIEPAFVRLAAQAGRDDDDVARWPHRSCRRR